MSPSITNSDMLLPPRKDSLSWDGLGGATEVTLIKLDWLPKRTSFGDVTGGGEGGSRETKDNRPAMSETRCCDDRLRGRGAEGERAEGWPLLILESMRMRGDVLSGVEVAGVSDNADSKGDRERGESESESGSIVNA